MSDLFHDRVPLEYIQKVFHTMRLAKQHKFQLLTKRSENLKKYSDSIDWPDNVWMGVSVETSDYKSRISDLQATNAKTKFLSIEPLLGPISKIPLKGINWVIVGGESGPGARPMDIEWVRSIRDQCVKNRVAFFFKQWGGVQKKKFGRLLDGRTWDQMPYEK
jgi:protein gp37